MKTIYKSDGEMFDTPAAVDRDSGILYLNPKLWFKLTPFQRKFVKLHEYGHYYLDTAIEEEADAYAFDRLAGSEFQSLKQCIGCLQTILDEKRPGHRVRMEALYQRALDWDKAHPLKPNINKASGSSNPPATASYNPADSYGTIIEKVGDSNAKILEIVSEREVKQDNNRTLIYGLLAIGALFLLND